MPLDPDLRLAELVRRVRSELEQLDARRASASEPPLFVLDELELELQFTVVESRDIKGGVDLKVISAGASKAVDESAVQRIRLTFGVDEAARRSGLSGTRAHSSQQAYDGEEDDVKPIE